MFETISGIRIARIQSKKDCFDITEVKTAKCFFNNSAVLDSKMDDQFAPIIGMFIRAACPSEITIKKNPSYADFVKTLIDNISKSEQVKVHVLDEKPDETTDNSPKELTFGSLEGYRNKVKSFSESLIDGISLSEVLLRTKLPRTMWGSKDLEKMISKVRSGSEELGNNKEALEIISEKTDVRSGQIMSVEDRKINAGEKQFISTGVDQVTGDFLKLKKLMSSFMLTLYKLYDINQLFKKVTGYPATWFFDPSVFYSFTERYEDVSDNLIDMARMESSVVRPLYAWKLKAL